MHYKGSVSRNLGSVGQVCAPHSLCHELSTSGQYRVTPLFLFFGCQPRGPASVMFPATFCDPSSLEFVLTLGNRLQQDRDAGLQAQVRMLPMPVGSTAAGFPHCVSSLQFEVGGYAWLDALECLRLIQLSAELEFAELE
jgi:hypothetical protein